MVVLAAYRRMFARLADLFKSSADGTPSRSTAGLYSRLMELGWSRNWLSLYPPEDYQSVASWVADLLIGDRRPRARLAHRLRR